MAARRDLLLMWLLSGFAALLAWRYGGVIPMGEGLGTDGKIYAALAADYFGQIERGVWSYSPDYYFQRSLPPFLVFLTHRALGLEPTGENLITLFRAWNVLALLAAIFFYLRCALALSFDTGLRWAGYLALFASVSFVFVPFYYPTLTDIFSASVSLALLAAFFERRRFLLAALALAAGFVMPTLLALGLALFVVPTTHGEGGAHPLEAWLEKIFPAARFLLALLAGLVIMAVMAWIAGHPRFGPKYGLMLGGVDAFSGRGVAGLLSVGSYFGFATWAVLGHPSLRRPVTVLRCVSWWRVALATVLFVGVKLVVSRVVSQGTMSNAIAISMASTFSALSPFLFLAKHSLYFGPVFLLFLLRFFPALRELERWGFGIWLFVAPFLLVGFDLESRHHLVALPALVLALLSALRAEGQESARVARVLGGGSVCVALLWVWVQRVVPSDTYHQFIWGMPDPASWVLIGLALLGLGFTFGWRGRA